MLAVGENRSACAPGEPGKTLEFQVPLVDFIFLSGAELGDPLELSALSGGTFLKFSLCFPVPETPWGHQKNKLF